jgi:branched-chain amino acid transport system ATP-binding protein
MLLEVKDLWVYYGGAVALRGLSFGVEEGEIVTLIGSNGAGKTTALRTIMGLKTPASGEIRFEGQGIDGKLPQDIVKKGISLVPEGRDLFPYMTVLENLKLGAYLRKDRDEISSEMEEIFKRFPVLKQRQQQKSRTLSGGEQQILAIARALMGKPKLLLLDEPSLGLSPMAVQEIRNIVRSINQDGVSVILVEQNAKLALGLARRGYVLEMGSIVLQGESGELVNDERVRKAYIGL